MKNQKDKNSTAVVSKMKLNDFRERICATKKPTTLNMIEELSHLICFCSFEISDFEILIFVQILAQVCGKMKENQALSRFLEEQKSCVEEL